MHDLAVLRALEREAGVDPAFAGELLAGLDAFCNAWDAEDRATWGQAGAILAALYERHAAGGPHELTAIGHAHIDTAWLWPLEETCRKALRTFATQVRLMDAYPEYVFAASQAQHYAWIRDRDPALWAASASASRAGSGCRSAAPGSSPTATCPRASRWPASSCTASASSSASSAAAARSSGSPTCSATPASCRSSCAAPG